MLYQTDALCIAIGAVLASLMDDDAKNEVIKLLVEVLENIEEAR